MLPFRAMIYVIIIYDVLFNVFIPRIPQPHDNNPQLSAAGQSQNSTSAINLVSIAVDDGIVSLLEG